MSMVCDCLDNSATKYLQRMFCTICYNDDLPERKFKKRDRKTDSGICLPCLGVVNRYFTNAIKGKRRVGKVLRNKAWMQSIEDARLKQCPGYADARTAVKFAKSSQHEALLIRRVVYESTRSYDIPLDLIKHINEFLFVFCKGPHCGKISWALWPEQSAEKSDQDVEPLCYDCHQCVNKVSPWLPRVGTCPPLLS